MSQQLTFDLQVDNKAAIARIDAFFAAWDAGVKNVGKKFDEAFNDKNVNVELRFENGKIVAKEIANAASAGNKLANAAKAIEGNFGSTYAEVKKSRDILQSLLDNTKKYKNDSKGISKDWLEIAGKIKDADKKLRDLAISGDQFGKSITGANIAAGLALDAIRGMAKAISNLVGQGIGMEVLMIQLKGFTGSAEAAQIAFDEFLRIAAATPFNVKQVAEGARTMMGFGISTAEATKRIEQLAIVAAATGGELGHMSRNLGQIQANQKAYTRDLMQFANQGIPIYQMLGEVMGKTTEQVRGMVEEGLVGYPQVAAALDLMTQKGSAFYNIAQEMDKTIASRIEALGGTITATAGKFIEMIQAMDKELGGPIQNTFGALINIVKGIGQAFDGVKNNVKNFAPIVVAIGSALLVTFGIALITNLGTITASFKLLVAQMLATKTATYALAIAQALLQAAMGNIAAIAVLAAAGVAAYGAYSAAVNKAAESQASLNDELEKESFSVAADSAKMLTFSMENLNKEQKDYLEGQKSDYDKAKSAYELQIGAAEQALAYLEEKGARAKKDAEDEITRIKEKVRIEKDAQQSAIDAAKQRHQSVISGLKEELRVVRERFDAELGKLDEQSEFAKELEQIRRKELNEKLRSGELSRKETLEIKEQLLQMDNSVRRRELLAEKAAEEKRIQDEIRDTTKKNNDELDAINGKYEDRIGKLQDVIKAEEDGINAIDEKLKEQRQKIKDYKNKELMEIYANEEAAIAAINNAIGAAQNFKTEMQDIFEDTKKWRLDVEATAKALREAPVEKFQSGRVGNVAGTETVERASGGPVAGGQTYQVNELGKEAFLSAAGKLSMINAPAFGSWKAPSSGTVIPAHLTKQLDIPRGGININNAAGMSGGRAVGSAGRIIQAAAGDTFNQNVTVQSANPAQTANNIMVEMARLRRRRFS